MGDDWDDNGLMVYFQEETPLYFTGSIYNRNDTDCELGPWPQTMRISEVYILQYGGATPVGPAPPILTKTEARVDLAVDIVGPLVTEPPPKTGYGRITVRPEKSLPQRLKSRECCEFLVRIEPRRLLECNYYLIRFQIGVPGRVLTGASRCLIKTVRDPDDRARLQKQRALGLFISGKPTEGLAALEKAVEIAPTSSWSWYQLGQFYQLQGKLEKAIEVYRRGAQRIPQPPATAEDPDIVIEKQNGFSIYKEINLNVSIDLVRKRIKREPIKTTL